MVELKKYLIEKCELCDLIRGNFKTPFYFRSDLITVVDCQKCGIPIWVLNRHEQDISDEDKEYARLQCSYYFPADDIRFREEQRTIKDHRHEHVIIEGKQKGDRIEPQWNGLYLTSPHADLISELKKKIIVKNRVFEMDQPYLLIDHDFAYGLILLNYLQKYNNRTEFENDFELHRVTRKEFEDWNWDFPV